MQKYFTLTFTAALVFILSGCADLEENPVGILAPESFFKEARDARTAMDGAYGLLANETAYGRKLSLTLDLLGDDADIGNPGTSAQRVEINEFRHTSNNGMITSFWPQLYEIASSANLILDALEDNEDIPEPGRSTIQAEARFLRAFVYFHLVRLFGDVPYIDGFVSDPSTVVNISQTPSDQIYANIISDLQSAIPNLPETWEGGIKSRATKAGAQALLSKVYLTTQQWQEAATQAEAVINSGLFTLEPDFMDLWDALQQDGDEVVYSIDFSSLIQYGSLDGGNQDDMIASTSGVRGSDRDGWGVNVPTMKFYESFPDDDYRKEVSFMTTTIIGGEVVPYPEFPYATEQRPHNAKYFVNPGGIASSGRNTDNNVPVFRLAEIYLIAAEALNEANGGPTGVAESYINAVRERARHGGSYPPDIASGLSQEAFRQAVWEERRLEFAFEFKRWYDIVRTDKLMEALGDPDNSLEYQPNVQPHHKLLPLPQDEIERNANLNQNEGY